MLLGNETCKSLQDISFIEKVRAVKSIYGIVGLLFDFKDSKSKYAKNAPALSEELLKDPKFNEYMRNIHEEARKS